MSTRDKPTQPVRNAHPPAFVMKAVNPITRALALSRFGRRFASLTVLQFDGRKTQKRYVIPVMAHELDDALVVFTDARWAENLRGGVAIQVRRGGRTVAASARIADTQESASALRTVLAKLNNPQRLGLRIDEGHIPTDTELINARTVIFISSDDDPPTESRPVVPN